MSKAKPVCQQLRIFLKGNLGPTCLAPLTGTDARALDAAIHIVEAYSYNRDQSVLTAFRLMVERMQPSTRELAFHAIAMAMDWNDRWSVWRAAGLPDLRHVRRCQFESASTLPAVETLPSREEEQRSPA